MLVKIYNRATGAQHTVPVDRAQVVFGRSAVRAFESVVDDATRRVVALPSRLISRQQLILTGTAEGMQVSNTGLAPVFRGSQVLESGNRTDIQAGESLEVGEYVLMFVQHEDTGSREIVRRDRDRIDELEQLVHQELLEALDIRRTGTALDLETEEARQSVARHLKAISAKHVRNVAQESLARLARYAIYHRLLYRVTAFGRPNRLLAAVHELEQECLGLLREVDVALDDIGQALGVMKSARAFDTDLFALEEGYDKEITTWISRFTPAMLADAVDYHIRRCVLNTVFGFGPIQELLEMDVVSEVMVVARDQIFIEKLGVVENSRRGFVSDVNLETTIQRMVQPLGRRIDKSSPLVDGHLPDGSRMNAVIPPLALKGACLTVRKFPRTALTLDGLVEVGAIDRSAAEFLRAVVKGRKNVIVSGGTGTGKTTLLNCLSAFIGKKERIVTIEDTAELRMAQEHVVSLEARPPNMEGKGAISIRDLLKNALRMRPDRIVVGECRGGEALDMLQAMNTGHDGSMTTAHANSPVDMVRRLETMVLTGADMPLAAVRDQIASAVDVIVQLTRLSDGRRLVSAISEVTTVDLDSGRVVVEDVFSLRRDKAGAESLGFTGYLPTFLPELLHRDLLDLGHLTEALV